MSEIKFACPHCRQHIACSAEYADLIIACPACGQPMTVPILSATDPAHPDLLLVASPPVPKRTIRSRVPKLDPWTEDAWQAHVGASNRAAPEPVPIWAVSSLLTIVLAAVLRAGGAPWGWIVFAVIVGALVSGYLVRKHGAGLGGGASIASAIGGGLLAVLFVMVAIPLIALSVLFVGCAACQ